MLDKTMIIYGSPMSDSNLHNHRRCPLVLLGKANGSRREPAHYSTGRPWRMRC
jgi:hypothetical protein